MYSSVIPPSQARYYDSLAEHGISFGTNRLGTVSPNSGIARKTEAASNRRQFLWSG